MMEDIQINYDGTVRNAQNDIYQMKYNDTGRDVRDPTKIQGFVDRLNNVYELQHNIQ